MALRDLARKGLGLFVELGEEEAALVDAATEAGLGDEVQALRKKSIGDLMREFDSGEASAVPGAQGPASAGEVRFDAPPVGAVQGDVVDFQAIYKQAGVVPIAFTAEQTLELIQTLPADLPLATKRQTLLASLNTLGRALNVGKEQVVLDANMKIQALAAFEEASRKQRDDAVAAMQQRVKELQAQIDEERQKGAQAEAHYLAIVGQCETEGQKLDDVQEFLTLDEGPSVMASQPRTEGGPRPPGT